MRWLHSGWSELHGLSGLCILWNQLSSHSLDSHIMLGLMESWFIYFQFIFSPRVKWTSLLICGPFSQFSSCIYLTLPCKFLPAPVTLNSKFCFFHLPRLLLFGWALLPWCSDLDNAPQQKAEANVDIILCGSLSQ